MLTRARTVLIGLSVLLCAAAAQAAPVFPVQYSANKRYLVDQTGAPFPIMGRASWFVLSLTVADYRTFINDTAARDYTAMELLAISHDPRGNRPPFNGNGDRPFLNRLDGNAWNGSLAGYGNVKVDAPDFTTPNEAYWRFVDGFLAYAESKGILVFMFPAYVGARASEDGWMQEMVANGPARMQSYGAWIATRYKTQNNLVWMMGGDKGTMLDPFDRAQTEVEAALLNGLKSVARLRPALFSAEWASEAIATDQGSFGASMTLNGAYSWSGDVNTQGRRAYAHTPIEPAFLLEEPYDEEGPDGNRVNPSATQPVRRFQWGGWLSTIGGYISGNGYVWPFPEATWRSWMTTLQAYLSGNNRTWPVRAPTWRDHLDTNGSRDMARLNAFMRSIAWFNLVPSGLGDMRPLITVGNSSASATDYIPAAATPDGTLLVAYVPPAHTGAISVDMEAMKGPARARWFDPTTGTYTNIGVELRNSGSRSFMPPGNNSAGAKDWVLVLDRP